jgi:uncharacterized membrane protein YphA (DoxX/SURF4 family)
MNVVIWIVQGVLAVLFLGAGGTKLTQPDEKLVDRMTWIKTWPKGTSILVGTAEVVGALGLILPAATKIAPVLTPIAASGLVVVMIGAVVTHTRAKEWSSIGFTVVLGALALFVAITRFGAYAL